MDPILTGSDFAHLRAFVAVAEALSFSRAAEALGVSPSALSQTIRAFEARIGIRLLHRTTRSVALTEAGENLLRRVRPVLTELGAAVGQVGRYRARPAGTVRVHASRAAGRLYLEPILAGFHARYPEVVIDITLDDAVVDVVAGGYDAALRIGEVIAQDLVTVRLGPDLRQIAVAAPDYLARHGSPQTPRDLLGHRCIRWRWPGRSAPYDWEFCADGHWFEVAVDGPLIVSSKGLALRAALAGIGIAFTVERTAQPFIEAGRLVPLLERWSAPFPGYRLCFPRQREMAPALRAFIDHLRDHAGGPAADPSVIVPVRPQPVEA